jgi:hypothetical protein
MVNKTNLLHRDILWFSTKAEILWERGLNIVTNLGGAADFASRSPASGGSSWDGTVCPKVISLARGDLSVSHSPATISDTDAPLNKSRGFFLRSPNLPLFRRESSRGPMSRSVRTLERVPVPECPSVRYLSIQAIEKQSVRSVWRSSLTREDLTQIYRSFSCSAKRRIASSSTSLWEIPSFCTNFRSNSCASELRRMLVCFFIPQIYLILWYVSRGLGPYAQAPSFLRNANSSLKKDGAFLAEVL